MCTPPLPAHRTGPQRNALSRGGTPRPGACLPGAGHSYSWWQHGFRLQCPDRYFLLLLLSWQQPPQTRNRETSFVTLSTMLLTFATTLVIWSMAALDSSLAAAASVASFVVSCIRPPTSLTLAVTSSTEAACSSAAAATSLTL